MRLLPAWAVRAPPPEHPAPCYINHNHVTEMSTMQMLYRYITLKQAKLHSMAISVCLCCLRSSSDRVVSDIQEASGTASASVGVYICQENGCRNEVCSDCVIDMERMRMASFCLICRTARGFRPDTCQERMPGVAPLISPLLAPVEYPVQFELVPRRIDFQAITY